MYAPSVKPEIWPEESRIDIMIHSNPSLSRGPDAYRGKRGLHSENNITLFQYSGSWGASIR